MTEQEFLALVKGKVYIYKCFELPHGYPKKKDTKETEDLKDYCIRSSEWTTGGRTGGSCWDTDEHVYHEIDSDTEPDLEALDELLDELCPQITYLQYKSLIKGLIQYKEYTNNCYYGNYYNMSCKYVTLGKLYERLKEMKIID